MISMHPEPPDRTASGLAVVALLLSVGCAVVTFLVTVGTPELVRSRQQRRPATTASGTAMAADASRIAALRSSYHSIAERCAMAELALMQYRSGDSRRPVDDQASDELPSLAEFIRRVDALEEFVTFQPACPPLGERLSGPLALTDELFMIRRSLSILRDPNSSIAQRALAFRSLCYVPEPALHLSADLRSIWMRDIYLAHDDVDLLRLSQLYGYVHGTPDVVPVYLDLLENSNAQIRASAVNALKPFTEHDQFDAAVWNALLLAHDTDESSIVRERVDDLLRHSAKK